MATRIIRRSSDLDAMRGKVDHVLTLFSGGLDSTCILKNLAQRILPSFAKVQP